MLVSGSSVGGGISKRLFLIAFPRLHFEKIPNLSESFRNFFNDIFFDMGVSGNEKK